MKTKRTGYQIFAKSLGAHQERTLIIISLKWYVLLMTKANKQVKGKFEILQSIGIIVRPGKVESLFPISHFLDFEAG